MKLTQAAEAKLANANTGGPAVSLTQMAIGDGNGNPVGIPQGDETDLVREVYRTDINSLGQNASDPTIMQAEAVISAATGGWAVREVGVFDAEGDLFAYGNFPDTYKPTAAEGSTRDMLIAAALKVGNADNVELVIDASIVVATRQWVLNTITAAYLLPGGTTGQVLTKASNEDGDSEWRDMTDAVNITVDVIKEEQTAAADQQQFTLSVVTTDGVAVYVDGLRRVDFTVIDQVTIEMDDGLPADAHVLFVQNEPNEPLKLRRLVRFSGFFMGQI
ncbi:MAG: phage tail protein [Pseudohongiellaceae bacterium]